MGRGIRLGTLLALCASCIAARSARAEDLVRIDVPALALSSSSNDFVDLSEDFLRQQGAFAGLVGQVAYDAALRYLGIPDALTLQVANFGASATLRIPSTGHVRAFTAVSPADLENQIEHYIKEDGADEWARFLEESNAKSALALLDGNPRAATALLAASAFRRFGIDSSRARIGYQSGELADWGGAQLRLEGAGYGRVDVDGFRDLETWDGALTLAGLGRVAGFSFSAIGQYLDYQGAKSYDVGLELGVPLLLARSEDGEAFPLAWQLTPFVQSGAAASVDLAAGGLFIGGGVVSANALQLGPIELTLANQLVYYHGLPVRNIRGYDFETELSQLILRNGVKAGVYLFDLVFADAGASVANFLLARAAVDAYASPFAGVGVILGGIATLRVGYEADLGIRGRDYTAHSVRGTVDFQF